MSFTYDYPRPSVTADAVVFNFNNNTLSVLLVLRKSDPFKNTWAFPGGFLEMDEPLEIATIRELEEETGLVLPPGEQLGAYGKVDRDPRGRTISIVYLFLLSKNKAPIAASSDASEVSWFNIKDIPELAFDHEDILSDAMYALRNKLKIGILDQVEIFNLSLEEMKAVMEILDKTKGA